MNVGLPHPPYHGIGAGRRKAFMHKDFFRFLNMFVLDSKATK
jgi:hypothetical protein